MSITPVSAVWLSRYCRLVLATGATLTGALFARISSSSLMGRQAKLMIASHLGGLGPLVVIAMFAGYKIDGTCVTHLWALFHVNHPLL